MQQEPAAPTPSTSPEPRPAAAGSAEATPHGAASDADSAEASVPADSSEGGSRESRDAGAAAVVALPPPSPVDPDASFGAAVTAALPVGLDLRFVQPASKAALQALFELGGGLPPIQALEAAAAAAVRVGMSLRSLQGLRLSHAFASMRPAALDAVHWLHAQQQRRLEEERQQEEMQRRQQQELDSEPAVEQEQQPCCGPQKADNAKRRRQQADASPPAPCSNDQDGAGAGAGQRQQQQGQKQAPPSSRDGGEQRRRRQQWQQQDQGWPKWLAARAADAPERWRPLAEPILASGLKNSAATALEQAAAARSAACSPEALHAAAAAVGAADDGGSLPGKPGSPQFLAALREIATEVLRRFEAPSASEAATMGPATKAAAEPGAAAPLPAAAPMLSQRMAPTAAPLAEPEPQPQPAAAADGRPGSSASALLLPDPAGPQALQPPSLLNEHQALLATLLPLPSLPPEPLAEGKQPPALAFAPASEGSGVSPPPPLQGQRVEPPLPVLPGFDAPWNARHSPYPVPPQPGFQLPPDFGAPSMPPGAQPPQPGALPGFEGLPTAAADSPVAAPELVPGCTPPPPPIPLHARPPQPGEDGLPAETDLQSLLQGEGECMQLARCPAWRLALLPCFLACSRPQTCRPASLRHGRGAAGGRFQCPPLGCCPRTPGLAGATVAAVCGGGSQRRRLAATGPRPATKGHCSDSVEGQRRRCWQLGKHPADRGDSSQRTGHRAEHGRGRAHSARGYTTRLRGCGGIVSANGPASGSSGGAGDRSSSATGSACSCQPRQLAGTG